MADIRLDDVIMSSFHESFGNREIKTASIPLSGSIPGASHREFTVNIPIDRKSAVFKPYVKVGSNPRTPANNSSALLDVVWTHNAYLWISNPSDNILRVTVDVDNPGSTASIASQTVNLTIYVFDTPFS